VSCRSWGNSSTGSPNVPSPTYVARRSGSSFRSTSLIASGAFPRCCLGAAPTGGDRASTGEQSEDRPCGRANRQLGQRCGIRRTSALGGQAHQGIDLGDRHPRRAHHRQSRRSIRAASFDPSTGIDGLGSLRMVLAPVAGGPPTGFSDWPPLGTMTVLSVWHRWTKGMPSAL
jgi:hypothetical protein